MKAILKFDLEDSDDKMAHERCIAADKMAFVLWEFLHNSRKTIEYTLDEKKDLNNYEVVDLIYEKFVSLLDEEGVSIDKLIE